MRFPFGLYRFWIPVTAIGCALVVVGLVQFAGRTKKIIVSKEDCNRIQIGMTREEVEWTIGIPPGNYVSDYYDYIPPPSSLADYGVVEWVSDEGAINVWFDEEDRVERVEFESVAVFEQSWFWRFRKWLGL